jgi:hypothetical protein
VFWLVPDKMKQQALMKGFVIAEKRIKDLKKKYKSLWQT